MSLPTLAQIEEELNTAGYKAYKHFFSQPHGWFKLYYNTNKEKLMSPLRLHYIWLPEINLGPYYVLSFFDPNNHLLLSHLGLETLRIKNPKGLRKISEFIQIQHAFAAYQQPWLFKDTEFVANGGGEQWLKIHQAWKDHEFSDEFDWDSWRRNL
jgi:hypothetical protein